MRLPIFTIVSLFNSFLFAATGIGPNVPHISRSKETLFVTHADSGYIDFPEVQESLDLLIAQAKSANAEVYYISKNARMCRLIKPDLSQCPIDSKVKTPKTFPSDLSPTMVVYESIGGEHSILPIGRTTIAGGNFLGCAGNTAASVLGGWIKNKLSGRQLVFKLSSLYNRGCLDLSVPQSALDFESKRLYGSETSMAECFKRLKIEDDRVVSFALGYLKLILMPWTLEKLEKSDQISSVSFIISRNGKEIKKIGDGLFTTTLEFND